MVEQPVSTPLALTNDGTLEIVFLGTGTAFARRLFQTNLLIIKGEEHVLVDFGMTGPQALQALGLTGMDIRTILPTHSHSDHIGGLEYLTLVNRYMAVPSGKEKLNMIITDVYRPILWDLSLRGGLEYNEQNAEGRRLSYDDLYTTHVPQQIASEPRSIFSIDMNGIKLELFHTNHIPGEADSPKDAFVTYGLLIDDRVFFSGDTKFDRDLIDMYADRSEIMFHDASMTPNQVHAWVEDLRGIPEEIRRKMYLVHYQDEMTDDDAADFKGLAKQGIRYLFP
ncbi:MAG: MBL fold metallo-hydrolase [Ignavibacteria bacterium]|nr:MBL fold metallo-hydrolase [Ignavibacteria bacterium]MBP7093085.1 MBL fold metallo-hydrolase [Candidatus Kapabacteria bacterium]MBK6418375.1 MBL fold metallo-hydrolase [Ignavibacteria bacterium]MBK6761085.1 MBL fold metallo-hydrolase [Ignavibacteria bacterium]MBK7186736.1 MBL fold metallo-hydrolase [Ignavibacteria bacterium]